MFIIKENNILREYWEFFSCCNNLRNNSLYPLWGWCKDSLGKSRKLDLIFWHFFDMFLFTRTIYFRGGITVITENGKDTQSHLIIKNAEESDSGNYTCKPSIFKTATVRLHVLNGKGFYVKNILIVRSQFRNINWNLLKN